MSEENSQQQGTNKRVLPKSDLDFNLMTTDSVWGSTYINQDLKDRVTKYYATPKDDGTTEITKESLWGLLGFYTRDMRLANLGTLNGELEYTKYFLDLAGDFLQANMIEPFLICLSRVATILELSQSKGGFLRRRMNTFTSESFHTDGEPPKKSIMGYKKGKS